MGSFVTALVCNILIPLIMIISGCCMYKKPPKEINGLIGYRSTMSMKNKDTWAFAHGYCGRLWTRLGAILLIVSIAVQIPLIHADEHTMGIAVLLIESVQLAVILLSIIPVERALKRTFDKDGNRK